jgi:hypothetical protein
MHGSSDVVWVGQKEQLFAGTESTVGELNHKGCAVKVKKNV